MLRISPVGTRKSTEHKSTLPTMAAAVKAFSTVELLESILFELGTKDLLFAQRVSKHWQAVIESSCKLQQALFFKSIHGDIPSISGAASTYSKVLKNPLLEPITTHLGDIKFGEQESVGGILPDSIYLTPSWAVSNASWRSMLPTQPATKDIFSVVKYMMDPTDGSKKEACSGGNIRMGDIVDELDNIIQRIWKPNACGLFVWDQLYRCKPLRSNSELVGLVAPSKQKDQQPP